MIYIKNYLELNENDLNNEANRWVRKMYSNTALESEINIQGEYLEQVQKIIKPDAQNDTALENMRKW